MWGCVCVVPFIYASPSHLGQIFYWCCFHIDALTENVLPPKIYVTITANAVRVVVFVSHNISLFSVQNPSEGELVVWKKKKNLAVLDKFTARRRRRRPPPLCRCEKWTLVSIGAAASGAWPTGVGRSSLCGQRLLFSVWWSAIVGG